MSKRTRSTRRRDSVTADADVGHDVAASQNRTRDEWLDTASFADATFWIDMTELDGHVRARAGDPA